LVNSTGRYRAQPGNPPTLYDTLLNKTTVHPTFESAVDRAYLLNRFSTGSRI
jgi:hypothetical protein